MATGVHSSPAVQQQHVSFPAVTTPANAMSRNTGAAAALLQQQNGTSQSLSALHSSLTLPANHPTSSAASSAGSASAPSLFSSYLLSILHTSLSDLHTVLTLSPASLDEPSLADAPALLIALKEQLQLEHHYSLLQQGWREMREGDEGWAEQRRMVEEQHSCIIDSTRALLRLAQPQAAASTAPLQGTASAFYRLFSHLVALVTTRLHLSAKESDKQQHTLHTLHTQHGHDTQTLQQLTQQLHASRSQHSTQLAQQHALLAKYQAALTNLLDSAEESTLNFNRSMKAEAEENERLFEGKQSELSEEAQRRRVEGVEAGMAEEWAKEEAMRRKVAIKQDEVARVIAQYDAEMEWEEEVYTELSRLYERERDESRRLALYFERVRERERKEAEELERLRVKRDEEVRRHREAAESVAVLRQLFDGWMKKNGPKEKKAADKKKAKPYKTMWRPPRDKSEDGSASARGQLRENEESKEAVTESAAE